MRVTLAASLLFLMAISGTALADNADSLLSRSRAAEHSGNRDVAIRLAQAAIVADPARAGSYTALGDLYVHAGEAESARFYYGEALTIDPLDTAAQRGLALADRAQKPPTTAAAGSLDKAESAH